MGSSKCISLLPYRHGEVVKHGKGVIVKIQYCVFTLTPFLYCLANFPPRWLGRHHSIPSCASLSGMTGGDAEGISGPERLLRNSMTAMRSSCVSRSPNL